MNTCTHVPPSPGQSRARELVASKPGSVAAVFPIDIEPDVRGPGYWTKTRRAA